MVEGSASRLSHMEVCRPQFFIGCWVEGLCPELSHCLKDIAVGSPECVIREGRKESREGEEEA